MKVKCIRADGSAKDSLEEGKIYTVEKEHVNGYVLVGVHGRYSSWIRNRFIVVDDEEKEVVIQPKDIKPTQSEFAKAMRFFQVSSHPDVCPKCAAPQPCNYHPV